MASVGQNLSKAYSGLTPMGKTIVAVLGVATITYVVYKTIQGVQRTVSDDLNRSEEQSTATELQRLNQNESTRQSISNAQASSYASSLKASMSGLGTYVDQIKSVFWKLRNDADFLAVSKAFGTQVISSGSWFVPDFSGTLTACLQSELNVTDINAINQIFVKKKMKVRV